MDDLITKRQAVERMNDLMVLELKMTRPPTWNEVYNAIEELPSAQQWIPCSERLPDQNGKYLVVGRQKAINILKFDGGRWYGKWGVLAWRPLPEPYKGENDG